MHINAGNTNITTLTLKISLCLQILVSKVTMVMIESDHTCFQSFHDHMELKKMFHKYCSMLRDQQSRTQSNFDLPNKNLKSLQESPGDYWRLLETFQNIEKLSMSP